MHLNVILSSMYTSSDRHPLHRNRHVETEHMRKLLNLYVKGVEQEARLPRYLAAGSPSTEDDDTHKTRYINLARLRRKPLGNNMTGT